MPRKKNKLAPAVRAVCEDALDLLDVISADWTPLLKASIASAQAGTMTRSLKHLLRKICGHLMSPLDYIATYAQSICPKNSTRKAYFFFVQPTATQQKIEKVMAHIFPDLGTVSPPLYELLSGAQNALRKDPSVFQELRKLNATMKHRLLPREKIVLQAGVTLVNWSSQPERPPLWLWTGRIDMRGNSSFAGGPGSLLVASEKFTCDPDSMLFGISGEAIHAGKAHDKVEILNRALIWHIPGVTKPLLQFLGKAVHETAVIVRQFVQMNGLWDSLWPKYRIAHFCQFTSTSITLNPGAAVEANWLEDGTTPSISLKG